MRIKFNSFNTSISRISLINRSSCLSLKNPKQSKKDNYQKKKTKTFKEVLDEKISELNSKD